MLKSYNLYNKIFESGIRDITKLSKEFNKANIYFHIDLDGITSAIAMKEYLDSYNIKTTKFHAIQYGEKEYDLEIPEKDSLPVLVDFSNGKIEFKIHTDHHEFQTGVATKSTLFKKTKSNVGIISNEISAKQIFSSTDVESIDTIDSASFAEKNIKPEDIIKFQFKTDKEKSSKENSMELALVTNKLLLSFKNKPQFCEKLVEISKPSIISIYNNLLKLIIEWNKTAWWKQKLSDKNDINEIIYKMIGYSKDYIETLKKHPTLKIKNKILMQYDAPKMFEPGKFDRYASFVLYPEANFFIMVWTMGLIQVSKNPFKENIKEINNLNLGELVRNILLDYKDFLKKKKISFNKIKNISEKQIYKKAKRKFKPELNISNKFGLRFKDIKNLFGEDSIQNPNNYPEEKIESIMDSKFIELNDKQKEILNNIYIDAWIIIEKLSGGHKDITNITGFQYLTNNGIIEEGDEVNKLLREIARKIFHELNNFQNNL
jgi:hypothetical protein